MEKKKYQIIKNSREKESLVDNWFSYCQNKQIPFIVVFTKKKYADIEFDYITLKPKYNYLFKKYSDKIEKDIEEMFWKYREDKIYNNDVFWSELIILHKIPIDNAYLLAEEIYDYINNFKFKFNNYDK